MNERFFRIYEKKGLACFLKGKGRGVSGGAVARDGSERSRCANGYFSVLLEKGVRGKLGRIVAKRMGKVCGKNVGNYDEKGKNIRGGGV